MRNMIIAGNWKMNKDLEGARDLAKRVAAAKTSPDHIKSVLGVPFPFLFEVAKICRETENLDVAAQNLYPKDVGAYTGEVSGPMITSCGAGYVILGHSERREYFNEDNEFVNEKVRYALSSGLKPIVCVGESLNLREQGKHIKFVIDQLRSCLEGVSLEMGANIIVAYEPIWAIGTGKTAEPEQAQEMHGEIRSYLKEDFRSVADDIPILYGGSMKPNNAESLLQCKDIDGGLIGGASLDASSFIEIRNIAESL